ncbi:MAG: alpha/beta fold hydrolase [Anaerolineales bacterium]|nr:alpha/beta fold hydrolase [Anaerolineales bacterium]
MTMIIPGGEPFFMEGGSTGCLLVHGFTASPQEMSWMGQYLHQRGYTVLGIRLAGHATDLQDLARVHWQDWLHSVEDGFHMLSTRCDRVVPIGISLGGALSLKFAASHPVPAVICMSTPYELQVPPVWLLQALSIFVPVRKKGPTSWSIPDAGPVRVDYRGYPLHAIVEMAKFLKTLHPDLAKLTCPVLLMHSSRDDFVLPENMEKLCFSIGSQIKQKQLFSHSNHILTCDIDRDDVFAAAAAFLEQQNLLP